VPALRLPGEHVAGHLAVDVGVVVGDVAGGAVAETVAAQHAGDPVAPHRGLVAVSQTVRGQASHERRPAAFGHLLGLRAVDAVALLRAAVAANPGGNRPGLASALDNLGRLLGKVGRPTEGLTAAEDAVAIRQALAVASPGRYRPALAASLENLAVAFSRLGRDVEAVTAIEDGVAIRRDLAAASPDHYGLDLAASLTSLSLLLLDVGRDAESDTAAKEASAIRHDVNFAKVERIMRELASLSKVADELRASGKDTEGVPAETLAEPDASSYAALDGEGAAAGGIDRGGLVGVEAGEAGQGDIEAVGGGGAAEGDQTAGEEEEQDSGSQALAGELAPSGSVEHRVDQQADVPVVDAGDGLAEANRDVAGETGGESEHPAFPT
jgi:hypothetical protein